MRLNPQDLEKIADLTLEHYARRAEDFWKGTRDHDVSQNIEALLRYIEGDPPFAILGGVANPIFQRKSPWLAPRASVFGRPWRIRTADQRITS